MDDDMYICCLVDSDETCGRSVGKAIFNKRIQKDVAQTHNLHLTCKPKVTHKRICDHHMRLIQTMRKRTRKDSDDENEEEDDQDQPQVDLSNLQLNTLRRFKRHYRVTTRPNLSKQQMVDILTKQFYTIPITEKEVLSTFIYKVKNSRVKLEQSRPASPEPH